MNVCREDHPAAAQTSFKYALARALEDATPLVEWDLTHRGKTILEASWEREIASVLGEYIPSIKQMRS